MNTIEEFNNYMAKAIPATWEEYEAYMLQTKQWKTAEEQYAIEAAVDALTDGDLDIYVRPEEC